MRFPLIHTGTRFFFFTIATAGRQCVLSRLERGVARPALLPAGEAVSAVWRGLHAAEPAFTASDWVAMPDHVHLLLIVRGAVAFNPLVFARWFMEATEDAAAGLSWHVPVAAARWMAPSPRGTEEGPARLWTRGTYVEISFDGRQLRAIRRKRRPLRNPGGGPGGVRASCCGPANDGTPPRPPPLLHAWGYGAPPRRLPQEKAGKGASLSFRGGGRLIEGAFQHKGI